MVARRSTDDLKEVIRDFRRDQVIEVARRLFGERGTTDVSMDDIAAEAGVARSTVYVYFANRDELLRACLKGMHDQLLEDIADTWEQDGEPAHRLERLIEGLLARIDDDPAFFRLALLTQGTGAQGGEAVGNELALISLNIARLIRDLYVEGVSSRRRSGTMDPDEAVAPDRPADLRGHVRPCRRARSPGRRRSSRQTPVPSSCTDWAPEPPALEPPAPQSPRLSCGQPPASCWSASVLAARPGQPPAPCGQPPATAGTIDRVCPSATGVASPSRNRTSSSARNTFTNRRSPPSVVEDAFG